MNKTIKRVSICGVEFETVNYETEEGIIQITKINSSARSGMLNNAPETIAVF